MQSITDIESAAAYGSSILQGRAIRFRGLHEEDLPLLDKWWSKPEWAVLQQDTVRPRPAMAAGDRFRTWSENASPGNVGFCIETNDSASLVGHVTLAGASLPTRTATLAIIMAPEATGRGLGADALQTAIRYGFLQMGLNKIELRTWAFNARALRAYSKAGFVEEGRLREAVFFNGTHHDAVLMGILRREWDEATSIDY